MRRVAAKIGYALFRALTNRRLETRDDERMRHYILGTMASPDEPVSISPFPETSTTSDAPHYIVLSPEHDSSAAIVSLYGFSFRVELGPTAVLRRPVVVICKIDGSGMRIGSESDIPALRALETATFSQPWLLPAPADEKKSPYLTPT